MKKRLIMGSMAILLASCVDQTLQGPAGPMEVSSKDSYMSGPSAPNLIQNPGLESSLDHWSNLGNAVVATSSVYSGQGAAKIGTGAGGLRQMLSLRPGVEYTLSGFGKIGVSGESGSYGVTFKTSDGKEIVNFQSQVTEATYTKKSLIFKAPNKFAASEVWVWKGAGASHLYLDDLSLVDNSISVATCEGTGSITHEKWEGVGGDSIADIPLGIAPSKVGLINSLSVSDLGDNYGTRISGYVCPPVSGNYTFHISGDNGAKLSLSSSDSPSDLAQIAALSGWTYMDELNKYPGQNSSAFSLKAGHRYFIEVLHKEGAGGDHVSVGWTMPDGKKEFPLPASRIAPKAGASTTTPTPRPTAPKSGTCSAQGKISLERVHNVHSSDPLSIAEMEADEVTSASSFEAPTNISDSYGTRMSGLICVPTSGDYTFYIAGDDQVALFISSDGEENNKKKIAYHDGWTNPRDYGKYPTQTSSPIKLEAGKTYFIEALHVEGGGGDNLSVGWKLPDGTLERPISGARLSLNPALKEVTKPGEPGAPGVSTGGPTKGDSFDENAVTYAGPIVITRGGTYSGNWQSTSSGVPAVIIKTLEPVVLENCVIRSASHLVSNVSFGADITIRNCRGYGLPMTSELYNDGNGNTYRAPRRFLNSTGFKNIVIENNYMEHTAGIYIGDGYTGNGTPSETIKVRYNKAKNIDGRLYGGETELVQFFQINVRGVAVPNMEVAYNQVVNEAGNSLVEDTINIFNSRGTPSSPMRIHHNYMEGAYPMPDGKGGLLGKKWGDNYSGGGIIADSPSRDDVSKITAYLEIYDNQMVSSMNYSFGIATGNNIKVYNNRAVISDYLMDGRLALDVFPSYARYDYQVYPNGYWSNDYYHSGHSYNNVFNNNLCGVSRFGERMDSFSQHEGTTITNHKIMPSGPITLEIMKNEYKIFVEKVKAAGVSIGPR